MSEVKENTNKNGQIIIIIGCMGSGKSPIIKRLGKNSNFVNKLVYDPRKEYDPEEYTIFNRKETFMKYWLEQTQSFIVIDEATGIIGSYKDIDLTEKLIAVQHNQNVIIFAFHACSQVPLYILDLCNHIILLRTDESEDRVKRTRPELLPYLHNDTNEDVYIDKKVVRL